MIRRLLVAALVAASAPVVLAPAPARAETQPVTDATFTWGFSGYAQVGALGPWTYPQLSSTTTLLGGSVSGGSQTEYVALPGETSMPASSPQRTPNAIKLVGGTGTADPATGAVALTWSGTYVVNAYARSFGAPDEIYRDPHLTIDAAGVGTLSLDVTIGAGQDIEGDPSPAQDLGRRTVLSFSTGSGTSTSADSFRYTADYQGVAVSEATPQDTSCAGTWGSWPAGFVNAVPDSIAPHFYSTGCGGRQDNKPPLPVQVDLGTSGQAATTTTVSAPARRYGQPASVSVAVSGAQTGPVALLSGTTVLARGVLTGGRATFDLGQRAVGRHPLAARYFGSGTTRPSLSPGVTLVVTQASTTTAVALVRKPTPTRAGSARVTVSSSTTTPAGKVTVRVKKGTRVVRTLAPALRSGRATVALPRLARGRWTVVASYAGSGSVAASTRTITLVVR